LVTDWRQDVQHGQEIGVARLQQLQDY